MHQLFLAKGSDVGPVYVSARAIIVFIAAIAFVRLAKKRFIAQASAMDLVMVVILGSVLSRGINGSSSLLSVIMAGIVLVILQRTLAHFSARSHRFGKLVKGNAEVLVRDGKMLTEQMRHHDITEHDLHQEMRIRALVDDLSKIKMAVLERSGQIGFVKATESQS